MPVTPIRSVLAATGLVLTAYPELEGPPTFPGRIARAEETLAARLARTIPDGAEAAGVATATAA